MFEQTFVEGVVHRRSGWTLAASTTLQFAILGAAMLVPLINPDILPATSWQSLVMVAPPPPAPPPKAMAAQPTVQSQVRRMIQNALFQPLTVPTHVAVVVDPPSVAGTPEATGVPYGVPNGSADGVVGSLLREVTRAVLPPPAAAPAESKPADKQVIRIRAGGLVQEALLIHKVLPEYPLLAKQARVSGAVVFHAIISRDGIVKQLDTVSGHPLLVKNAAAAVSQWRYRPTMLNGDPVEVDTVITVTFKLSQ